MTLQGGYGEAGRITISGIGLTEPRINLVGDGTFNLADLVATSNSPIFATAGDFNGDGILDLTSADWTSNRLSVFLGNGDGTFSAATTLATGVKPVWLTLADFNGDGALDLTSSDKTSNQLSVFLGNTQAATITSSSLPTIDLNTQNSALQAIPLLAQSRNQVASQRGIIGAGISRLQIGISNLREASQNFAAAESRTVDADVALESANLVKNRILQQTGAAMLSQASSLTETALLLLAF